MVHAQFPLLPATNAAMPHGHAQNIRDWEKEFDEMKIAELDSDPLEDWSVIMEDDYLDWFYWLTISISIWYQ